MPGLQIIDGTGDGNSARVNKQHRIFTEADTHTSEFFASLGGDAYFVNTSVTADTLTAATTHDGPLLFLQNDNTDMLMAISNIFVSVSAAAATGVITLRKNMTVATIGANNAATPSNLNFASGRTAEATAHAWDESGTAGITGLSGGTILNPLIPAQGITVLPIDESFLLGTNDNLVIGYQQASGSGIEVTASIRFHYLDPDSVE